jgi:two-component system, OmpR family, response regulator MprA
LEPRCTPGQRGSPDFARQDTDMASRLLVVDDDRAIRDSLARALQLEGYEVATAPDGAAALGLVSQSLPDLLVLDVMMPNLDGLTLCRVLRAEGNRTPILMLTARTETSDRIAGLDAGADDYLPKPFDYDELLARLRALLRRSSFTKPPAGQANECLSVADLVLDPLTRTVTRAGAEITLSKTEFDLLELLLRNMGAVLSHGIIYDRIWGYDFGPGSNNLAVYISYLRRKIDSESAVPLIHTVRGVGYSVHP